jgi:hypothetical protein
MNCQEILPPLASPETLLAYQIRVVVRLVRSCTSDPPVNSLAIVLPPLGVSSRRKWPREWKHTLPTSSSVRMPWNRSSFPRPLGLNCPP